MSTNMLFLLFFFIFFTITHTQAEKLVNPSCKTQDQGSTLKVYHVASPCSPFKPSTTPPNKPSLSWEDNVLQMQRDDKARLAFLSSLAEVAAGPSKKIILPIASGRQIIQSPTYIVRAKIGTPPQTLLMAVDNSVDAVSVPCSGCVGCSSTLFNAPTSTTFQSLGCQASQCAQVPSPTCGTGVCAFNTTYAGSTIASNLSADTITLGTDAVPSFVFGCVQNVSGTGMPPQGILGLGRGLLSLMSQTQSLYTSTFSYCLPSFRSLNFSGSLKLGPVGQPIRIKTTPLLKNPRRSSLYYVNLISIRVGRKIVDIPASALAFNPTTGAGTIFDSGSVFTQLVTPAYTAVRDEFRKRVGNFSVTSLGGFDTCYNVPIVTPTITFMFSGMNVTLPPDNLLIHSTAGSITCLAMAAAPNNVNSVLNVIGSMQQQNHRVLYDLPNSRLGVAREQCT